MVIVTWNPNDKSGTVELSNGNLNANTGTSLGRIVRATKGVSSGKWYFEIKIIGGNVGEIGVAKSTVPLNVDVRSNLEKRGYRPSNGNKTSGSIDGASWLNIASNTNDVIGVLLNLDLGELTFYKNGVLIGTPFSDLGSLGEVYPYVLTSTSTANTALSVSAIFGGEPFTHPIPDGYKPYQIVNKSFISLELGYKKYENGVWSDVAPTLPTLTQFQSEGMDDLSLFDRKVQAVLESPQAMTNSVLGEGKVFKGTVSLTKYFDLRKLEVK